MLFWTGDPVIYDAIHSGAFCRVRDRNAGRDARAGREAAVTDVLGDAELIKAVRAGDAQAYGELYRRHHASALRFARWLAGPLGDAEDIAADAFARVLAALKTGKGPHEAFRPYLLSAVRNICHDQARRAAREPPVGEPAPLAPGEPFIDPVLAKDEGRLIATAFSELPERWQLVLWHTEVEGEKPAEVAPLLGISANAVAALAYRAREGLRERYLKAHLGSAIDDRCRQTVDRLAAHARNKLSRADAQRVQQHLEGCGRCRLLFIDLTDINSRLGAVLGPIVLGNAAGVLVSKGAPVAGASMVAWILARLGGPASAALAVAAGITTVTLTIPASPISPPAVAAPNSTEPAAGPPATALSLANLDPAPSAGTAEPTISSTPGQPKPGRAAPPMPRPPIKLIVHLGIGSLSRGHAGTLVLAVTNATTGAEAATVNVTATLLLPAGITLRSHGAGDGWTCATNDGAITCEREGLRPGQGSPAVIQIWASADAAGGVPSALVSGPLVTPVLVAADGGL
jgi:RNA polymerase sigma factor (sigma-70 family)